jgi:hypothetical protein
MCISRALQSRSAPESAEQMTRALLVAAVGLCLLSSCRTVECGANTIEVEGTCVAMAVDPGAHCAPGTSYDATSGRCESDLFENGGGVCGENTTQVTGDDGITYCIGTGGGGCAEPLVCPPSTVANTVSLCGRVFDLEDSAPLDDGDPDNGEPYTTVELRVLDPIAFIVNPSPPVLARATPDSCGRFAIANAPRPGHGLIALVTDDITDPETGQPQLGDNLVVAGIADAPQAGQVRANLRAWILRRSTDLAWSQAAGLTGESFGTRGVYIPIFLSGAAPALPFPLAPTPGVKVAIIDGSVSRAVLPENDFYFEDTAPLTRLTLSATREETGANGTALYINQPGIADFSGLGATPPGMCWVINQAASPRGGAFVQERALVSELCP